MGGTTAAAAQKQNNLYTHSIISYVAGWSLWSTNAVRYTKRIKQCDVFLRTPFVTQNLHVVHSRRGSIKYLNLKIITVFKTTLSVETVLARHTLHNTLLCAIYVYLHVMYSVNLLIYEYIHIINSIILLL